MAYQLRNFYSYDWTIIEQQGKITFKLFDASCFYETFKQDDLALQDWLQHFKRRKKPFVLAKGKDKMGIDKATHWCLFATPGWDRHDGIKDKSQHEQFKCGVYV